MSRIDDLILSALKALPPKPGDAALNTAKKRYSEQVSQAVAIAFAEELRQRGLTDTRPSAPGENDKSGAERRMAGGIGAKKVDVTWATEEAGLLLALSVKTINFRDRASKNFQKNLTNRRGDMLMEAVTLHRRFPYAVLGGLFFLDAEAATDGTEGRHSTFVNAHHRLKLFNGRPDPAGRDEQFERLYLLLMSANSEEVSVRAYSVGVPDLIVPLKDLIEDLLGIVAERNPDFYEIRDGVLVSPNKQRAKKERGANKSISTAMGDARDMFLDDDDLDADSAGD